LVQRNGHSSRKWSRSGAGCGGREARDLLREDSSPGTLCWRWNSLAGTKSARPRCGKRSLNSSTPDSSAASRTRALSSRNSLLRNCSNTAYQSSAGEHGRGCRRRAHDERRFPHPGRSSANISAAVSSNAYYELALADLDFHRFIWERSGDGTLFRILEQVAAPLFAFTSIRFSSRHKDLKHIVLSHETIVAALRARDPVAAKEAVRQHIEDSFSVYLNPDIGGTECR